MWPFFFFSFFYNLIFFLLPFADLLLLYKFEIHDHKIIILNCLHYGSLLHVINHF